ncbi:MAG: AAA family ATPase, partial [Chloroflexia bacterium]|nr:AAA family ATPase [Chloroflexia bacterium]
MARSPDAERIYEAADQFRQRCLIEQRSLLWPEESAWTLANLDALWDAFIGCPDEGKRSFMEKLHNQLADQPVDVHRIAADAMALYSLFPSNMGALVKRNNVREVISWKLVGESETPDLARIEEAFQQRIGTSGIWYLTGGPWQVAFYLDVSRRVLTAGIDPYDVEAITQIADEVRVQGNNTSAARHILLHLLFPDRFERIASEEHKRRIAATFIQEAGSVATDGTIDDQLLAIRHSLTERLGRPDLDFYQADLRALWDPEPEVLIPPPTYDPPGVTVPVGGGAPFTALVDATHLHADELREIEELLNEKRQIVFEGPPGSGKTYVAELFARWFVGLPLGGPADDRLEIVQFHQSYGYEDFVQGIRPETDRDGHLRYRVRDGIFMRLCGLAAQQLDRRFVLIIDEINRGNVARIFGELLLLLEYRDKRARLPYASPDAGDDACLAIPDNLYLIGTMNSTDRSLSQIDYALRRRFYFRRFLPVEDGRAPVLDGWPRSRKVGDADRARVVALFVELNRRVQEQLSPDFQIGHSYFMVPDIATDAGIDRVWRRAIRPLLEEYFHSYR